MRQVRNCAGMTTYSVANWGTHYENNRSRTVKELAWVPIPNKHDGERYSRLMLRPDAAQIFSAWILILQVASRCQPRGTLLRSGGTPHDSESLSIKTRAPREWFDLALPVLVEMNWLSLLASHCQDAVSQPSPTRQSGDYEWKEGMEENGKKGWVSREAAALPESLKPIANEWADWIVWWSEAKNQGKPMMDATAREHWGILIPMSHVERVDSLKHSTACNYAKPYPAPKPKEGGNGGAPEKPRRLPPNVAATLAKSESADAIIAAAQRVTPI